MVARLAFQKEKAIEDISTDIIEDGHERPLSSILYPPSLPCGDLEIQEVTLGTVHEGT